MKKILLLFVSVLCTLNVFGQTDAKLDYSSVNSVTKVGDTLEVKFNYFKAKDANGADIDASLYQFDFQYNNKLLNKISSTWQPTSTSAQKAINSWNGYKFNPDSNKDVDDYDGQYTYWLGSNSSYPTNSDWSVERITYQDVTALGDGSEIIKYKFIIKDKANSNYSNYSSILNANWVNLKKSDNTQIGVTKGTSNFNLSLSNIEGGDAGNVTLTILSNIIDDNIGDGTHFTYNVYNKSDIGAGNQVNEGASAVATGTYDASGQAVVTGLENDKEYFVWNYADQSKDYMDNVVTVSDLALVFAEAIGGGNSPNGSTTTFDYYIQTFIANIFHDEAFDGKIDFQDSYEILAYLQGVSSDNTTYITYKGRAIQSGGNESTFGTIDENGSYFAGIDATFKPTDSNKSFNFVHALMGDVNFSHSWEPDTEGTAIPTSQQANASVARMSMAAGSKFSGTAEEANLDLTSELKDGLVEFTIGSQVEEMIGAQFNIIYDRTRLVLDNVIFDTGNTMTNFSNHIEEDGKINIGSFDQNFEATVKTGTPYKLIFTPIVQLQNTSGLITFKVNEGVKADGTQINFIME
jgi:hypothetical protein